MLPPPAATKPKTPIAFARSAGSVKRFMISESETAETIAPPRPCTARAAIRSSCEFASPQRDRRDREERDPDQEQAPVAVEVAEPPAEQQEAAEGEQIGVHDPGERGLREAEVLPDRRQRDVHDRRVEDDHQRRRGRGRTSANQRVRLFMVMSFGFLSLRASTWFRRVRPAGARELIGPIGGR